VLRSRCWRLAADPLHPRPRLIGNPRDGITRTD
jgi:hypothetical protein